MHNNIHTPQTFMDLLQQERARVHRNGHPFSLILFRISEQADSEQADSEKTVPPGLFPTIAKRIRNIDQLGRYDSDHIGLLLPHTAGDGARKIADELFKVPVIASHLSECEVFVYP